MIKRQDSIVIKLSENCKKIVIPVINSLLVSPGLPPDKGNPAARAGSRRPLGEELEVRA